ncbi:hypothetical protein BU107_07015 [Staphylococcus xylosus]|uniref:hypothetical protein n=1 Tax=Staphylococcus xylosus TaxID=1288 RepID=UPI000E6777AF|nr:hypothetical protein [Staphylococcus xylosus]RIM87756.1 hypothetical protein BU107_07015 [Staphylococcus xylosus]
MLNYDKCFKYLESIPHDAQVDDLGYEELDMYLFDAFEDIKTLYPQITITERMIVKQMLYKFEGEQQGYAALKRQGVKTQKINDASITFNDGIIDPFVLTLIEKQLEEDKKSRGMIGRLI